MNKIKIGYTTGVFDMFHIGHLNILKNAKDNCDFLIVGVTSDETCASKKNKKPIIPYEERKMIVESIRFVDQVVKEDNTNKIVAWEEYQYDIIFKGSDWKGSPEWTNYEDILGKYGVEVKYFPYTEGTSSTQLRNVIANYQTI